MANIIIQNRLKQLVSRKRALLRLKKKQRGGELKTVNEKISRLRRWQTDLNKKSRIKQMMELVEKRQIKMKKPSEELNDGELVPRGEMQRFHQACGIIEPTFCDSVKYSGWNIPH